VAEAAAVPSAGLVILAGWVPLPRPQSQLAPAQSCLSVVGVVEQVGVQG